MKNPLFKGMTKWQIVFRAFFHGSLFLMLFDWGCPLPYSVGPIGLYELFFLGCFVAFVGCMIEEKGRFFGRLWDVIKASKGVAVALFTYLLVGGVTVLYSPDLIFGLTRYIVVGQMLLFGLFSFYYLFDGEQQESFPKRLSAIAVNMGITSVLLAAYSLIGFFAGWYTLYLRRVSPIQDYNQFSTILLMGLCALTFYLIRSHHAFWKRYTLLFLHWVLIATAVYTAGSRRSYVLICVFACVVFVYAVYTEYQSFTHSHQWRRVIAVVCVLGVCTGCCVGTAKFAHTKVKEVAAQREQILVAQLEAEQNGDEHKLENIYTQIQQQQMGDVLESLADGTGFTNRVYIWEVALEKIMSSDGLHLMFGYGASYSFDYYDDTSESSVQALHQRYPNVSENSTRKQWMNPHNLFLQDMLEGGLVLLLSQLVFLVCLGWSLLWLLCKLPHLTVPIVLMDLVLYITLFVSSAQGMKSNKFFWLLLFAQMALVYWKKGKAEDVVV